MRAKRWPSACWPQDGTAEEAHRAIIRAHQRRGHLSAALRQFELCRAVLRKELGAEPDRETAALVADAAR